MTKRRLTVTVDAQLAAAGATAVAEERAESLSAWVNEALTDKVARERRLAALADAIAAYEADHGVMSEEELDEQARADRYAAAATHSTAKRPGAA